MVCRENKGRSAQMGIVKAFQRQYGDAFNDAEVQSLIHQVKHDGDALDTEAPVTVEEQIDMMRRLRAQVASMDVLSEAEKYRVSDQRPGVITRIDQEIKRLESGKDERGKPLRPAQFNSHSHIYAMQRIGQNLERLAPAKEQFLDTNARHRGISYDEAKAEWNALMKREGHFEARSKVSDDLRESLATAGVDAQTQMNLGVSGRAVDAMEIMERRRLEAVDALEKKSAIGEGTSMGTFVSPKDPKARLKCKVCGQFGHDESSCPNTVRRDEIKSIERQRNALDQQSAVEESARYARNSSDDDIRLMHGTDDPAQWRQDALIAEAEQKKSAAYLSPADRARAFRKLDRAQARLEAEIRDTGLKVSPEVSSIDYNKDTGLLVVQPHPDADGNQSPAVIRRCRPAEAEEFAELARTQSLKTALDATVGEEKHQFANRQDAEAALTMHRCPSCGQWASLNSGHRCPVPGGPSEQAEHDRRRRRIEEQQRRRREQAESGEYVAVLEREQLFSSARFEKRRMQYTLGGQNYAISVNEMRFGKAAQVAQAVDDGKVATPSAYFAFPDGVVQGKASVWATDDGTPVMSLRDIGMEGTGLRCDCAQYKANGRCKHLAAARSQLMRAYRAHTVADGVLPGEELNLKTRTAPDGLELNDDRPGINRLMALKNARRREEMSKYLENRAGGYGVTTLMVEGPTNQEGEAVDWPETWSPQTVRDDGGERKAASVGKETNLRDSAEVADRMRYLLSNRMAEMPGGSTERLKFSAKKRDIPGGITVNIPKKFMSASPGRRRAAQRALAETLGVPPQTVTSKGVFIPDNPATYAEFLDRAAQNINSRRINGPRTVAVPTREQYEDARRRATRGGDSQNPIV